MQGEVPDEKTRTIQWTERPTGALVGVVSLWSFSQPSGTRIQVTKETSSTYFFSSSTDFFSSSIYFYRAYSSGGSQPLEPLFHHLVIKTYANFSSVMVGPGGLLLVGSHVYAVPVSVLLVGLQKKKNQLNFDI